MAKEEPIVFTRRASGLVREIGLFTAIAIPLTHTIGGGINKLLILASYSNPGANVPLAYILAGIPVLMTAIAYTLLAVSMPRTGGDYIYISRGINPVLGFLTSWGFWWTEIMSLGIIAYYDVDFWGLGFRIAHEATGNEFAASMANTLKEGTTACLAVAVLIVLFSGLITYLGARIYGKIIVLGLLLGVIGSVLMILFFLIKSPGDAATLWNETYGGYDEIVALAKAEGWEKVGFSAAATGGAAIGAVWAYIGFTAAAYMGGEVKNPSRGMVWSITFSAVMIIFYYAFIGFMVYRAFGDFIPAYTYCANEVPEKLGQIVPNFPSPLLPTFAAALAPGQHFIQIVMAVSAAIWLLNDIPAFFLVASRLVFSWSFDRFFPEKIAEVNDRFHSPHYAIAITTIGGLVGVVICAQGAWTAAMETTMLYIFAVMFGCLAAAVTPYVRREVYDRSIKIEVPGALGLVISSIVFLIIVFVAVGFHWFWGIFMTILGIIWLIAGLYMMSKGIKTSVPLMSIAGVAGLGSNFYLLFVAGAALGPKDLAYCAVWMTAGLIIFLGYYAYNIRRGVDVNTIYAEIPPA
jgi:APA family basic amino acid/polyamine antiporter